LLTRKEYGCFERGGGLPDSKSRMTAAWKVWHTTSSTFLGKLALMVQEPME